MTRRSKALDLSREKRLRIYKLVGEGYTAREVMTIFNDQENLKEHARITLDHVQKIISLPESHSFINKFRIEFYKTLKDIPVSEKKMRLHDMEKIRMQLVNIMGELNPHRKDDFTKFITCTRQLIGVLDLARSEMEYKPNLAIGIGLGNMGDLHELTDEQLTQQRNELIRKAASTIQQRSQSLDDDSEGDEPESTERSAAVLLAASKELRRDGEELQERDPNVSDLRQQDGDNSGLSAVRIPELPGGDDGVLRSEPVGEIGGGGGQGDHPRDGEVPGVVDGEKVLPPDGGTDIR